jgi:C-terminal processing protease CtpA/Prc
MQHNAEKYIEDTFPLVDNFGHLWPEVASPAREERRAQRSAAPPPVALRAPKAAAQGPPNIHSQTAGIGINFVVDSWDSLVIGSLVPGGPAERKGTLREGDVLISVDGLHLMGQRLVFDDVLNMVRGADGSDVILEFERPGKSERHKRP